jgi:hypothetical protein
MGTTSGSLFKAMICEGDTISRLGVHDRPGSADFGLIFWFTKAW